MAASYALEHGARHHADFIDAAGAREKKRRVKFYVDGSVLTVDRLQGWDEHEREGGSVRGKVEGFSAKSRKRFLLFVSSLSRHELPLFLTLTYPGEWPEEWNNWKEHLDTWTKNHLARRYPGASAVWKLEPQERGAPHYHLIVWGVKWMDREWLARTWYEVVGSGDEKHLRAGTRVERARSFKGVMCYAGKKYLGKEVELPPGWASVGRFWGVVGRKNLPRSRVLDFEITERTAVKFRRQVRRWLASKGKRWTGRNVQFYTQAHLQWCRVIEWAEGSQYARLYHREGDDAETVLQNTPF